MKRLLFVDHVNRILGGAEINLLELLPCIRASGEWEVAVAGSPGSPLGKALAEQGVTVLDHHFDEALNELRLAGGRLPWAYAWAGWRELGQSQERLQKLLAEYRPTAVISCTGKDHIVSGGACRALSIPCFWWVNDIISPDFFSLPVRYAFKSRARKQARRVITVSDFARQALLDQGMSPDLVKTIHNGIPVERYAKAQSAGLREKFGLPPETPLFGWVGRFTPWKGPEFFLQLAEIWLRRRYPGNFVLVGKAFNEEANFELRLRERVRKKGLEDRIHFVPFQSDITPVLADLTVLMHTSVQPEPFGRVIIEAMAAGVPVVATNAGGVPEILKEDVNGLLAMRGDLPDYYRQLARLAGSPEDRQRLSAAALATVRERFTVERVWRDWEDQLRATA